MAECLNPPFPVRSSHQRTKKKLKNWLKVRQDNQSYYNNRHTKELPKLHRDQAIYAQDPVRKTWNPARVVEEGNSPRSYIVETGTGAHLRRNRIHLRPNNTANNLANNLSNLVPQGRMMSQSSSVNSQELTPVDNSANNLSNSDQITM